MSAKKEEQERQETEARLFNSRIARNVLDILGAPDNLRDVQVKRVDARRYRVNIRVDNWIEGETSTTRNSRIAHSYFLHVNGEGNITDSSPPLRRHY